MIKLFFTIILSTLLSAGLSVSNQNDRKSLLKDFDYFFEQFEVIHPEPYRLLGGEKEFHRKVDSLRKVLVRTPDLDAEMMREQVTALLAPLHDGHTHFGYPPSYSGNWKGLPIAFKCAPYGLTVEGTVDHEYLLGAQLKSIQGITLEELLGRIERRKMAENIYGLYLEAAKMLIDRSALLSLLGCGERDAVEVAFTLKDGRDTTLILPFMADEEMREAAIYKCQRTGGFPEKNMTWGFADKECRTMVYRMNSVMSLDCFRYLMEIDPNVRASLEWVWPSFFDGPVPEDTKAAVEMLPSATVTFARMLESMKARDSRTLIIDLRGNGGGFTPIVYPMLYEMYGDAFLKTDMGVYFSTRISEQFLKKNGMTLEEMSAQRGRELHIDDMVEEDVSGVPEVTDAIRRHVVDGYMSVDREGLQSLGGNPIYTPERVYVLTDEKTFSAAFHTALMLKKMGAVIVGVPSSQSPNTYMEVTDFTLPYSGMNCSVSNSVQRCFPDGHPDANVLWPDIMLTRSDYAAFDFDKNAELLYCLQMEKLDDYFDAISSQYMGSAAVRRDGRLIYQRQNGYASVGDSIKAGPHTKYMVGSISKTFTAVLTFQAINEGLLSLDDHLEKFFPGAGIVNADRITIDQMMHHQSGIRDPFEDPEGLYYTWNTKPQSREDLFGRIVASGADFEPGTGQAYCNANYILLTFILEDLYGRSYSDLVRERICAPLGLSDTYYAGKHDPSSGETYSYAYGNGWELSSETDPSVPLGAGGIISTPSDLTLFAEALFDGRLGEGIAERMCDIQGQFGRGLFHVGPDDAVCFGHLGGIDGYVSLFTWFPQERLSVAICSNGLNMRQEYVLDAILRAVHGEDVDIPDFKYVLLRAEELMPFSGTYTCPDICLTLSLFAKGAHLYCQVSGQQPILLDARRAGLFECQKGGIEIEFGSGFESFVLRQAGQEFALKRSE